MWDGKCEIEAVLNAKGVFGLTSCRLTFHRQLNTSYA